MERAPDFDVTIVGAGPAGLSLARSLAACRTLGVLQPTIPKSDRLPAPLPLKIAVIEQQDSARLADPAFDGREIALTRRSVETLKRLGIWTHIDPHEIAPLTDAQARNGRSPLTLRVDHLATGHAQLGHLVPNHLIRRAAWRSVEEAGGVEMLAGTTVLATQTLDREVRVVLSNGASITTRLVVAADSRFSALRRAAGIPARQHDYGKTMLVCRMTHTLPHHGIAQEWFAYGGTVARLPLNGRQSSLVLTRRPEEIAHLLELDAAQFAREAEQTLRGELGAMQLASTRHAYPLVGVLPAHVVAPRLALIGDAAVGMHPVTAHGFNLGLLSQNLLAEQLLAAHHRWHDVGDPRTLAVYQRRQQRSAQPLYWATHALVQLYTDDRAPARMARHAALGLGARLPPLRHALARMLTGSGSSP